jgi:hypothetical protein
MKPKKFRTQETSRYEFAMQEAELHLSDWQNRPKGHAFLSETIL